MLTPHLWHNHHYHQPQCYWATLHLVMLADYSITQFVELKSFVKTEVMRLNSIFYQNVKMKGPNLVHKSITCKLILIVIWDWFLIYNPIFIRLVTLVPRGARGCRPCHGCKVRELGARKRINKLINLPTRFCWRRDPKSKINVSCWAALMSWHVLF